MVVFIWNVALIKLSPSSDNTRFFVYNISSSTLQLIWGKSSNLWKLLRYLSGIVTSLFKGGTGGRGGHGGWVSSGFCAGCEVLFMFFLLFLS